MSNIVSRRLNTGGLLRRRLMAWTLVWAVTLVGLRLTLLAAEVCPQINVADIHQAAVASADWIANNQTTDGKYLYDWDINTNSPATNSYNLVRHAGTTMALYQFAAEGQLEYLKPADQGLEWLLQGRVDSDDKTAISMFANGQAKLGTAALLTVGLIHRRIATTDTRYDNMLRRLGNMMRSQQRIDGSMLAFWDSVSGKPVPDRTSLFATGEALWAIALLHTIWPDEGWDETAWQTLDYLASNRDTEENVWPRPWADQWAAYALHEMAEWGLTEEHTDYARELAAQWGIAVRWESQRNGGIDGLVHAPESIAAGQGTWLEGLGMLASLAKIDKRLNDLENDLSDRLLCSTGRMIAKQELNTGHAEIDGGFFVGGVTRVDGQQHVLSGLIFAERLLREMKGV